MPARSVPDMRPVAVQASFDELGRALREVTFCVVDLETTGGSPTAGSRITEVGAVKVRGGELLGDFQTLVNPIAPIPPFIAVLTGITDTMVATAPPIGQVLPSFLEFARGCVLVAHNAPFDVGFLTHCAAELGQPWPGFEVLDTAVLARRVVTRDEAPNCKLSTLARVFRARTTPIHRALDDARATVDVLHGLIERLGGLGVHTLEELQSFSARVTVEQRRKRHLAEPLPHAPGVYLFRGPRDEVLYVGTSRDLRSRVRRYFTASETRTRMGEMVGIAESVTGIVCATPLEAEVRELRLIAEHKPRYNRRSRHPERGVWLKLTAEPWPRLSLVRQVLDDGADYAGPFGSRRVAERALAALHETFPIRQCTQRLSRTPHASACVLAEMARCLSPCDGTASAAAYSTEVERVREALVSRPGGGARAAGRDHGGAGRAGALRGGGRAPRPAHRAGAWHCAQPTPQRPDPVRRAGGRQPQRRRAAGRSTSCGTAGWPPPASSPVRRRRPRAWVRELRDERRDRAARSGPAPAATPDETEVVLRWLEAPGVRLVHVDGEWTCPVGGSRRLLRPARCGQRLAAPQVAPFDDRRDERRHYRAGAW